MLKQLLLGLACLVILPSAAFAQASITGVVKDSSGAVLPGVTVEASSDVLIEKVRAAVTDGSGTYRIVDLRAGVYTITFGLTGFSTVRREGIELTGTFTASINADLKVGSLAETITVSGETPIVDTQSVKRQVTVGERPHRRDARGAVDRRRHDAHSGDTGGSQPDQPRHPGHPRGGLLRRRRRTRHRGAHSSGWVDHHRRVERRGASSYVPDIGNAQEISLTSSGGMGEMQAGGPVISIMPKTGGNSVKGTLYASNITSGMVGDNYTQDLRDRGLTTPGKLYKLWDYNVAVGGPIKKDRIWFFFQFRDEGSHRTVPGMFANANMGDPTKWTYVADTSRPAVQAGSWRNGALRLTLQPTTRNKFNVFWDQQIPCQGAGYLGSSEGCRQSGEGEIICGAPQSTNPQCTATSAPEVGTFLTGYGQRVQQATWTSPVSRPSPARGGPRHIPQPVGRHRTTRRPADQSRADDRAVHGELREQRQHPEPDVPLGAFPEELSRGGELARIRVLRDRPAEHEVRVCTPNIRSPTASPTRIISSWHSESTTACRIS